MTSYYRPHPITSNDNPFLLLLEGHMHQYGWKKKQFKTWRLSDLIKNRKTTRIIHYHWPEAIWRSQNILIYLAKVIQFLITDQVASKLGYKRVLSLHNVLPHNTLWPKMEYWLRKYMIRSFDLCIGHAHNCEEEVKNRLGLNLGIYVLALHGSYEDYYLKIRKQDDWDKNLITLSENKITIALFLNKHHYLEGVTFIKSFIEDVAGENYQLVVAGSAMARLRNEYPEFFQTNKIMCLDGFIPDSAMHDFLNNIDAIALPYYKITTSGLFFLAGTYGKKILCPKLPFFESHDTNHDVCIFIQNDLQSALLELKVQNETGPVNVAAFNNEYSWSKSAQIITAAYKKLL